MLLRRLLPMCRSCKPLSRQMCLSSVSQDINPEVATHTPATRHSDPIITNRKLSFTIPGLKAKQAWVESLSEIETTKVGMVDLHPDIFGVIPRLDVLYDNIRWQRQYRSIDYRFIYNKGEMPGTNKKPWPQKGTGRARHGTVKSPIFKWTGGKSFGPRGPKNRFYMLPYNTRVSGLRCALSAKFAQDNLRIIDQLDLPTDDPLYLYDLVESRGWGLSALFVTDVDVLPENTTICLDGIPQFNVLPVYGLNVMTMLKHETLVLTLGALEQLEERLLFHMHKQDFKSRPFSRVHVQD